MSEEGGTDTVVPPVKPAVTYRLVAADDIGNADLTFYKKKADVDEPEDPLTPVDADGIANITADNMAEYMVENAADVVKSGSAESGSAESGSSSLSASQIQQGVELAEAIAGKIKPTGGRRRSRRRHAKKSAKKSKKSGARKSKKGGRSCKNGSKRRAQRKH